MGRSDPAEAELNGPRRFFAADLSSEAAFHTLDAEALKHARVLRLTAGAQVELFDGQGREVHAELASRNGALVAVPTEPVRQLKRNAELHLVQCLPKGNKLDDLLRACGELGVAEVHLAISERCVARPKGDRAQAKAGRHAKIALEAARQAEQPWATRVHPAAPLGEVLARAPQDADKHVLLERSEEPLSLPRGPSEKVWLVVGPEGGLGPADREHLQRCGFAPAGLGSAILRVETAAVVGVTLVMERLGALSPQGPAGSPDDHTPDGDHSNR